MTTKPDYKIIAQVRYPSSTKLLVVLHHQDAKEGVEIVISELRGYDPEEVCPEYVITVYIDERYSVSGWGADPEKAKHSILRNLSYSLHL